MVRTIIVTVVCSAAAVCGVARGDEPEKWLKDIAAKTKAMAKSDLAQHRDELALAKKGKVVRGSRGKTAKGYVFENVSEKKQMVSKLEYAIKSTEQLMDGKFGPLTDNELLVGVCGVPYYPVGIIQIASDIGAIIDIGYSPPYGLAFKEDPQRHVWLEHSTEGWTDGSLVDLKFPVIVVGTHRYETVIGGSKTIPKVRVLNEAEIDQFRSLLKKQAD